MRLFVFAAFFVIGATLAASNAAALSCPANSTVTCPMVCGDVCVEWVPGPTDVPICVKTRSTCVQDPTRCVCGSGGLNSTKLDDFLKRKPDIDIITRPPLDLRGLRNMQLFSAPPMTKN